MHVADIAAEIYQDLGQPSDTSVAVIAYWLRNNYGQLNVAINTNFYLSDALEIVRIDPNDPNKAAIIEIEGEEKDVYKAIYNVYYMDIKIRTHILSYTNAPVVEVQQDGNVVRIASATEIGKNLAMFRKSATDTLKSLITAYKIHKSRPRQVAGTDDIDGTDNTLVSLDVVTNNRLV